MRAHGYTDLDSGMNARFTDAVKREYDDFMLHPEQNSR
jgi:hypothetical protein